MSFPKSFVSTDPPVALSIGIKHRINSLQRLKTLTQTNLFHVLKNYDVGLPAWQR